MGTTVNGLAEATQPLMVRLVRSEERARWRQLMNAHHDLGFRPIIGQSL